MSLSLLELYGNHCRWCEERGIEPADFDTWRRTTREIPELNYNDQTYARFAQRNLPS